MNGIISVIVPVYNVERYIAQCIESLIHQSYLKLEIILVDDGSSDRSGSICDAYAKNDERIIVIHQKNGGAASARNAGLRIARGEYLSFVDSDDYLDTEAYSILITTMRETDSDVVEYAFREDYLNNYTDKVYFDTLKEFSTEDYLKLYTSHWISGLAWDKLFKRSLFYNIYYEEGHIIDDEFFTYQGVMHAEKIIYLPVVLYHYRMRKSSVMRNKTTVEKMLFDRLAYSTIRREKIVERFPRLKQLFDYSYLDSLLLWAKDRDVTELVIIEIKKLIRNYFKENKPCKMSLRFRMQLLFFLCMNPANIQKKRNVEYVEDKYQYFE